MHPSTLNEFISWNDQLVALVEADVPVNIGLESNDVPSRLREITSVVARRVSEGASVEEALKDHAVPIHYGSLMQLALQTSSFSAILNGDRRLGESVAEPAHVMRSGLVYPLIIIVFVYFGMIVMCQFFVPALEDLAQSLNHQPGPALTTIRWMRESFPYWATLLPLSALVVVAWNFRRTKTASEPSWRRSALSKLVGLSQSAQLERYACFADALAMLVEDHSWEDSLRLAAGACDDAGLKAGAEALADSLHRNEPLRHDSTVALRFPPFLRWAMWHSDDPTERARALRISTVVYRDRAQRDVDRVRTAVPAVACAVLGGGLTFLYGMTLFLPVVELIVDLSR